MPDLPEPRSASPADDAFATSLAGFGPLGLLSFLVILAGNLLFQPLTGILVLVWARLSRTPWRDLGFSRPRSWVVTVLAGVASGIVFKFLMKALVMPLLGADPVNHAYHYLVGNRAALPGALYALIIGAGFGEETFFRGYLFERIGKRYGSGPWAKAFAVALTSAWFGIAHYSVQGFAGAEQATITGLVFGTVYAVTGRIWVPMIAHAAFDLTALWMIYWDLETRVAHLIFK
jgi:membrane protease YdiL (CAAX protease family)